MNENIRKRRRKEQETNANISRSVVKELESPKTFDKNQWIWISWSFYDNGIRTSEWKKMKKKNDDDFLFSFNFLFVMNADHCCDQTKLWIALILVVRHTFPFPVRRTVCHRRRRIVVVKFDCSFHNRAWRVHCTKDILGIIVHFVESKLLYNTIP